MKLRRSVLYVPGNRPYALEKSRTLAADCVVYDLEDSVGPQDKDKARENVVAALSLPNTGIQERIVRINGLNADMVVKDVDALKHTNADAVLLPKIDSAEDVRAYRKLFGPHQENMPGFWLMAETPRGILNIAEIATSDAAVAVITVGLEDLSLATRIKRTPRRDGFIYAISACVMAARAYQLDIIDGVYTSLDDEKGFMAECRQAIDLGFDGKSLIHPRQVDVCNQCFSPAEDEIRRAQEIVAAWDGAQHTGQSVVVLNGQMIEHLHVTEARRVLSLAAACR